MPRQIVFVAAALLSVLVLAGTAQHDGPRPPGRRSFGTLADTLADVARVAAGQPQREFGLAPPRLPLATERTLPVTIRTHSGSTVGVGALGIVPRNTREGVVEAYVSPDQLLALANAPDVSRVDPIIGDRPRVESEGLAVHNVAAFRSRNLTGAGVKIGIVDSFGGLSALQGQELPLSITGRCYADIGQPSSDLSACMSGSNHGTAVAETFVDVAPGADVYIANPISNLDFMDALNWMAAAGVKVINYSASRLWDGPGDGRSPDADSPLRAVDEAVARGAVFVSAAGNEAHATWFGPFSDTDGDRFQEFGALNYNSVYLTAGWLYVLQVRWEDSWTAAHRDLDVGLYDVNFNVVAASTAPQAGAPGQVPFELVLYTPAVSGVYHIGLYRFSGGAPAWIQLQSFTDEPLSVTAQGRYSIGSPAESANAGSVAVGAAPWNAPLTLEPFSSQGPTPDGRIKPDVVGVDRASTVTYGPGGFAGTSQASPHVAGILALIRQQFPNYGPAEAVAYLAATAQPRGPKPNVSWGHGLAFGCSYVPSPTSVVLAPTTTSLALTVTTASGCPWSISSQTAWITASPSAGTGTGVVQLSLQPNPTTSSRSGAISIEGVVVTILQHGLADQDGDTLPDEWEERFGLDPSSSAGADGSQGDPDGDGRTNAQEHAEGTHPRGLFTRYLAEGAESEFFATRIALLNPGNQPSTVLVRFMTTAGTVVSHVEHVPGGVRTTIEGATLAALNLGGTEFSTVVESDVFVVADRTMSWNRSDIMYGSHSESSVASPAPTWYLAEGATHSGFQLFYLIQNPSLTGTASVQVRYLLPSGPPLVRSYEVGPSARFTIWVNTIAELASVDVSAVVQTTNDAPIIVERAMYLSNGGRLFQAGHESAGVTARSLTWFFAEGATGPYFDEFILMANPDARAAAVDVRFFGPTGESISKQYTVPPLSRFNIWVDLADARLADTAVSASLTVTNGVPIVAERAMWWPGPTSATWSEGHNSAGATATATRWAMAEGEDGGVLNAETYVLIANTSPAAAQAKVTAFTGAGVVAQRTYDIPASSRFNIPMRAEFPAVADARFGVMVESLGESPAALVVERAHYSDAGGEHWAAGSSALAMPWPP